MSIYYKVKNNGNIINVNTIEELNNITNKDDVIHLYISNTIYQTLPNELCSPFINLQKLHIFYNINLTQLPNLEQCTKLEILYCPDNNLTQLPHLEYNIKLKFIACYKNPIKLLPRIIIYCSSLYNYKPFNEYKDNINIPDLIHWTIKKYYYFPIMNYYHSKYLENE
jgi:Leucine-rich repeat (LRR) protein